LASNARVREKKEKGAAEEKGEGAISHAYLTKSVDGDGRQGVAQVHKVPEIDLLGLYYMNYWKFAE
jgi:hypothetical protein